MKRLSRTRRCAALLTCAGICLPNIARAQQEADYDTEDAPAVDAAQPTEPERQAAPARPVRAAPMPAQVRVVQVAPTPPPAAAPPAAPPLAPTRQAEPPSVTDIEEQPDTDLIVGGLFIVATAYGFSAMAGADSPVRADKQLYIPIAGPWLDLARRPRCGTMDGQPSCKSEAASTALLIGSGLVQDVGTMLFLGGFLFPKTRIVRRPVAAVVLPNAGPTTVGLTAAGTIGF